MKFSREQQFDSSTPVILPLIDDIDRKNLLEKLLELFFLFLSLGFVALISGGGLFLVHLPIIIILKMFILATHKLDDYRLPNRGQTLLKSNKFNFSLLVIFNVKFQLTP